MVEEEVSLIETKVINRLKSIREEMNISQLELSLLSGVSQNMITYIETGKRTPSLRTIIKLCKALNVSPTRLFEEPNQERDELKAQLICAIKKYL